MNNGEENHTELLTVQETAKLSEGASFLGLRTHAKTFDRSLTWVSARQVLAFPRGRSACLGSASANGPPGSLTCGLH